MCLYLFTRLLSYCRAHALCLYREHTQKPARAKINRLSSGSEEDVEINSDISMVSTMDESPVTPMTRSNLSEQKNELQRTPKSLPRATAWPTIRRPMLSAGRKLPTTPKQVNQEWENSPLTKFCLQLEAGDVTPYSGTPQQVAPRTVWRPGPKFVAHQGTKTPVRVLPATPVTAAATPKTTATPTEAPRTTWKRTEYSDVAEPQSPVQSDAENEYLEIQKTPAPGSKDTEGEYVEIRVGSNSDLLAAFAAIDDEGEGIEGIDVEGGESAVVPTVEATYETPTPVAVAPAAEDVEQAPYKPPEMLAYAAHGLTEKIEAGMNAGDNVNCYDQFGRTPLMYSLQYGQLDCARWIIMHGGNVDQQTADGATALHYAAHASTYAEVKILIGAGAKLCADVDQRSPLHWAMHNPCPRVLNLLLSKATEVDINLIDTTQMSAVMWAAYYGYAHHIRKLRSVGALFDLQDENGLTALHWSTQAAHIEPLKLLLSYKSSFVEDNNGKSVILFAAERGKAKHVKAIVSVRPQAVHDVDHAGRTALHWAAACRQPDAIRQLLKSGSHSKRVDVDGKNALDYARQFGFEECAAIISLHESTVVERKPRHGPFMSSTTVRTLDETYGAENVKELTFEAREILKILANGTYLFKFCKGGKGALQKRYFWTDCFTGEVCWVKNATDTIKDSDQARSGYLLEVLPDVSEDVRSRVDYDPKVKHKWGFTLVCENRNVDIVAPSEAVYRIWVDGLDLLKQCASVVFGANSTEAALRLTHLKI